MTIEKHKEVIIKYRALFEGKKIPKQELPESEHPSSPEILLSHCYWMLDQIEAFLDSGNIGKANRWLGFIQGSLWANKLFTVEELKEQNRSDL